MRKPRLSESTVEKLFRGEKVNIGKYEYETGVEWDDNYGAYIEYLYRWDENNNYESWEIPAEGLWAFLK